MHIAYIHADTYFSVQYVGFLEALCEYSLLLNCYTTNDIKAVSRNGKMDYSSKKVICNYVCVELPSIFLISLCW